MRRHKPVLLLFLFRRMSIKFDVLTFQCPIECLLLPGMNKKNSGKLLPSAVSLYLADDGFVHYRHLAIFMPLLIYSPFSIFAFKAARASLSPKLVEAAWFWIVAVLSSFLADLRVAFFSARASAR